jgi:hypothetical protein
VVLIFPSPKSQLHEVGEFVEVSVNCTVSGATPELTSEENPVTGAAGETVIVCVAGFVLLPPALLTVREAV